MMWKYSKKISYLDFASFHRSEACDSFTYTQAVTRPLSPHCSWSSCFSSAVSDASLKFCSVWTEWLLLQFVNQLKFLGESSFKFDQCSSNQASSWSYCFLFVVCGFLLNYGYIFSHIFFNPIKAGNQANWNETRRIPSRKRICICFVFCTYIMFMLALCQLIQQTTHYPLKQNILHYFVMYNNRCISEQFVF